MKKLLFYYSVVATLLLVVCGLYLHHTTGEVTRLRNNNEALSTETKLYKTRLDESAASVVAMQLKIEEYRKQHAEDLKRIRSLGVQLRRVESIATSASQTKIEVSTPIHDTVFLDRLLPDTATLFRWSDNWVNIEGLIRNGKAECYIESIDTLRQVVHRVPRSWWFIRFGTKAIRQEITSSNPHTQIVYSEYIELPKRHSHR
jgi:hypothetical protein